MISWNGSGQSPSNELPIATTQNRTSHLQNQPMNCDPVCQYVFLSQPLDDVSLPDPSMIDDNTFNFHVDDTYDDTNSVSCTIHKLFPFNTKFFLPPDSMTDSTVTCGATDNDLVGNASIATLKIYEVFNDDMKYCFMDPRPFP